MEQLHPTTDAIVYITRAKIDSNPTFVECFSTEEKAVDYVMHFLDKAGHDTEDARKKIEGRKYGEAFTFSSDQHHCKVSIESSIVDIECEKASSDALDEALNKDKKPASAVYRTGKYQEPGFFCRDMKVGEGMQLCNAVDMVHEKKSSHTLHTTDKYDEPASFHLVAKGMTTHSVSEIYGTYPSSAGTLTIIPSLHDQLIYYSHPAFHIHYTD
jgi:hypothetical protein